MEHEERNEPKDPDFMPCGHSRKQVESLKLGCNEDGECRPLDVRASELYYAGKS